MGLSVSEKKELRSIIANRITMRSDRLKAEHKDLLASLADQARLDAYAQLGIAAEMEHLNALNARKAVLERDVSAAEQVVYDRVKHLEHVLYHSRPDRIQKPLEEALFQATPLGQRIAQLTAEKSRLDETVWAATSTRQVSDIFQALNTLLNEPATVLEQAAHDLQHPDD